MSNSVGLSELKYCGLSDSIFQGFHIFFKCNRPSANRSSVTVGHQMRSQQETEGRIVSDLVSFNETGH